MNFLERIPTRWLLTAAALACLFLWAGPGWAQTTGDPVAGRLLFEDTPGETGQSQLGSCTNCHSIHDRRNRIATGTASATPIFTAVSFTSATNRFGAAIAGNFSGAMGQYSVLDNDQFRDIAAYIADTPKTSVSELDFTATAINTNTLSQHVDLTNAQTSGTLTITNVAIGGAGAARFNATADNCTSQTLAASTSTTASSCRVSVRFSAPNTATYSATLTMTMRVGGSMTTFTRVVPLSGQVASTPPPPSGGGGDSGGGGLGLAWLAGLALAVAALARQRRGTS